MPRNVRPCYVTVKTSGRRTEIGTGPAARNGSLTARFTLRSHGTVIEALDVRADGYLTTETIDLHATIRHGGNVILPDGTVYLLPAGSVVRLHTRR